jgi:peptide/nickel transport system ATP-binding protein
VILDEPTTALDVIVQAQIINLLKKLKKQFSLSFIFITHDLALEAEISDRICVMYAGKIVVLGSNAQIYGTQGPAHPYTERLLAATPRLFKKVEQLQFIPGTPPDLIAPPKGCRFNHAATKPSTDVSRKSRRSSKSSRPYVRMLAPSARLNRRESMTDTILSIKNLKKYFEPTPELYSIDLGRRAEKADKSG